MGTEQSQLQNVLGHTRIAGLAATGAMSCCALCGNPGGTTQPWQCPDCHQRGLSLELITLIMEAVRNSSESLPLAGATADAVVEAVQSHDQQWAPTQIQNQLSALASGRTKVYMKRMIKRENHPFADNTYHIHPEGVSESLFGATATAAAPSAGSAGATVLGTDSDTATMNTYATAHTQAEQAASLSAPSPENSNASAQQPSQGGVVSSVSQPMLSADDTDSSDDEPQQPPRKRTRHCWRRIEDDSEPLGPQLPQPQSAGDMLVESEPEEEPALQQQLSDDGHMDLDTNYELELEPALQEQLGSHEHMDVDAQPGREREPAVQEQLAGDFHTDVEHMSDEQPAAQPTGPMAADLEMPYTVPDAGVVVHSLGHPYSGQACQVFEGSTGSHHPYLIGYRATKTVFSQSGRATDWTLLVEVKDDRPYFKVSDEIGYTYEAPEVETDQAIAAGVPAASSFGFTHEPILSAIWAVYIADLEARLQVGHPRLMEGSEAVHNTPQQALNQPQYTAADMAAEGGAPNTGGGSPQPTLNSAGPALQAQENVTTAWGVMSDDELIYQLVSRLLQQQGHSASIDMELSRVLRGIRNAHVATVPPEEALHLLLELATTTSESDSADIAHVRKALQDRVAVAYNSAARISQMLLRAQPMLECPWTLFGDVWDQAVTLERMHELLGPLTQT